MVLDPPPKKDHHGGDGGADGDGDARHLDAKVQGHRTTVVE